jgi:hypothetical protein
MLFMVSEKIKDQYQGIADAIEADGLGYALTKGGYIRPEMTDDPELKEAIQKAMDGCNTILKILKPYLS